MCLCKLKITVVFKKTCEIIDFDLVFQRCAGIVHDINIIQNRHILANLQQKFI